MIRRRKKRWFVITTVMDTEGTEYQTRKYYTKFGAYLSMLFFTAIPGTAYCSIGKE